MTAQPSLPLECPQPVKGAERFAECRWRVAQDCGGFYAPGAICGGYPLVMWVPCAAYPNFDVRNPGRPQ